MIKPKIPRRNIETQEVVLKPYYAGAEQELYKLIRKNLPGLTHSFPQMLAATRTPQETREYVQTKIRLWNKNDSLAYLIFYKDMLSGHFNFKDIDWKVPKAELAYWIDEPLRGKGIITDVIKKFLQFGFEELNMERIFAKIVTTNIASERALQKAGLKYEGTFIKDYRTYDNRIVDTHVYALTRDDYFRMLRASRG